MSEFDREQFQRQLQHEGLDHIAEFLYGPTRINELEPEDFLDVLRSEWVIRLRNDDTEIQSSLQNARYVVRVNHGL